MYKKDNFMKTIILMLSLIISNNVLAVDIFKSYIDLKEEVSLSKKENKLIMILFQMEHCVYCKRMRENTLTDNKVVNMYSSRFNTYSVDIKSEIEVGDFDGNFKMEKDIANKIKSTPTIAFYGNDGKLIYQNVGFKRPDQMLKIGRFVSEGFYKKMTFEEYSVQSDPVSLAKNK